MSEAAYQKKLQDALRQRGAWVAKYPAGPHGVKGVPDLICCYRGAYLAVECKAGDPRLARYKLTPSQENQRVKIISAGGTHLVSSPGLHLLFRASYPEPSLIVESDLDRLLDDVLDVLNVR